MRRLKIVGGVMVLAFAVVGCAGRYMGPPPRTPLEQVMANNNVVVCTGDVFIGPPVNKCLRQLLNIGPHLAGYSMFSGGSRGRALSRAEKIAIISAATGGVGWLASKDWRVATGAAAAAAVVTAIVTRGDKNKPSTAQQPQMVQQLWGPGAPFGGRQNCQRLGLYTLRNGSGEFLRVYNGGVPYADLGPRAPQNEVCAPTEGEYSAEIMSPVVDDEWIVKSGTTRSKPEVHSGGILVWR